MCHEDAYVEDEAMRELARANSALRSRVGLVLGLLAASMPASAARFAGGTGRPDDPYQIATAEQLIAIGQDPNLLGKHFVLTKDLDLDPNAPGGKIFSKAVIAANSSRTKEFKGAVFAGRLDGKGHKIRHLTLQGDAIGYLGLFGRTGPDAEISNLTLEDARIGGSGSYIGGLVGYNQGRIVNCHVTGSYRAELADWCCHRETAA
jgi:hypothetical protein